MKATKRFRKSINLISSLNTKQQFIQKLNEIGIEDIPIVGGKNASLGEMIQHLTKQNIKVPNGYAVTVAAFEAFIDKNHLREKINAVLEGLDSSDIIQLRKAGSQIRKLIPFR